MRCTFASLSLMEYEIIWVFDYLIFHIFSSSENPEILWILFPNSQFLAIFYFFKWKHHHRKRRQRQSVRESGVSGCNKTRDKSSVLDDKHALFHIQTGLPSTGRRHRHLLLHNSTCNWSSVVLARFQKRKSYSRRRWSGLLSFKFWSCRKIVSYTPVTKSSCIHLFFLGTFWPVMNTLYPSSVNFVLLLLAIIMACSIAFKVTPTRIPNSARLTVQNKILECILTINFYNNMILWFIWLVTFILIFSVLVLVWNSRTICIWHIS